MTSDYYKYVDLDGRGINTAFYFDSLPDMRRFVKETIQYIDDNTAENRQAASVVEDYYDRNINNTIQSYIRSQGVNWYGTRDTSWATSGINTFLRSDSLESDLNLLRDRTVNVEVKDIDLKKKIEFTQKEIGVFSFDLASLGLIRVYEYYSPLLNQIVKPYLVNSFQNENGERIFYHVGTPYVPEHQVTYDPKEMAYYSKILGRTVDKSEIVEYYPQGSSGEIIYMFPERNEIPRHDVERKQKVDNEGRKKFSSTYKKSFIYIARKEQNMPRIDLIVPVFMPSAYNLNLSYWNSIAALSIIEKLTQSGINFRLTLSFSTETYSGNRRSFIFLKAKGDGEPVDPNLIAISISDPRFYRSELFKVKLSCQFRSGLQTFMREEIGRPIRDENLIVDAYMNFLSKQSNMDDYESSLNRGTKIFIPEATTREAAIESYNNVIQKVAGVFTQIQ